MKEMQSSSR